MVAILADDDGIARLGPNIEMHLGPPRAIGLHELQLVRLLLDTCATAHEACVALLATKDLYTFAPLQYLVADRTGGRLFRKTPPDATHSTSSRVTAGRRW